MILVPNAFALETLGSVSLNLSVSTDYTVETIKSSVYRVFLAEPTAPYAETDLFNLPLVELAAGRTFTLDGGPGLESAVALFSNSVNEFLVFGLFDPSVAPPENIIAVALPLDELSFCGSPCDQPPPFPGFEIKSLVLTIDEVSIREAIDGVGSEGVINATLTVYGSPKQPGGPITVAFDIHPMSCLNPFNMGKKGVVPAAILGTGDFDVQKIDVNTIQLLGLSPIRFAHEDVATPFPKFTGKMDCFQDCWQEGPDGILDLTLKFAASDFAKALGDVTDRECRVLKITGSLRQEYGGTPIEGEDVVLILLK